MNLIANIALLVAALLDIVVLVGGDITDHRNNGHSNSMYHRWLNKSGELLSPKRLLLYAVFMGTATTMAQESWIVVMILAAVLLIQGIVLLSKRQWKIMGKGKYSGRMLATALLLVALILFGIANSAGRSQGAVHASQVTSIAAVMIACVTWLLPMITAWMLRIPVTDVTDSEPQDPRD